MRRAFFFLAAVGLLLFLGRFLFAIWFVGVIAALLFFAFRGIRQFIRQGRYGRPAYEFHRHSRSLPEAGEYTDYEPLVPVWRQSPEALRNIRIIPVE